MPPDAAATAFTHSSWAAERTESYERLEFLGDSVLELAVAHELDLGARLARFNEGEDAARLARNRNVLAALLEAVLGALFLEQGFAAIEDAIVDAFSDRIEYALTTHVDHKTELQEALARLGRHVTYTVLDAAGPPHERHFTCAAVVGGEQLGTGQGRSKKAAEQEAAREALERLEQEAGAA